jgi:hypothetical protein
MAGFFLWTFNDRLCGGAPLYFSKFSGYRFVSFQSLSIQGSVFD